MLVNASLKLEKNTLENVLRLLFREFQVTLLGNNLTLSYLGHQLTIIVIND